MKTISIGEKCDQCGADSWAIIDENNLYKRICTKCCNYIEITKIDYLRNFQCPECNCFEGKIEENDNFLAVRCTNCGKQTIMLEKHATESRRTPGSVPTTPETYEDFVKESNQPKCPKCGSTEFTPVRKKWSLLAGFATNKTELICNKCGTKVK